jgi:uncharacterized membrane protein YqjE
MDDAARNVGGSLGEYAYPQGGRERPVTEVLRDIVTNVQEMVRSEVRLARVEMSQEVSKTARAGALLAAGAVLGAVGGVFLLVFVAQLLGLVMPAWAATLIVGLVVAIVGFALITTGKNRLRIPTPEKTIENVKENVEWMKNQTKS